MTVNNSLQIRRLPEPRALLTLIKPITWFPPMWAFMCGAVCSGVALGAEAGTLLLGLLLAGPLVCGMSQAANDWCDRHVDAINEPDRPIPSGRVPGRWGLWVALAMSALSLAVGGLLGPWGIVATTLAVIFAWAYSAEPVRAKRSGVWGPGLVALSYEALPWLTGAAVLLNAAPPWQVVVVALLYASGAHGIMTLNDFKALKGDRATGIQSLPVVLGPERAARLACIVMAGAQLAVIAFLWLNGWPWHAGIIALLLALQLAAMRVLLRDPKGRAPWYNGTGVTLYVSGMMVAAFALRGLETLQ
ncbi:chlorophyll synthase ChlG [Tropicimonas sp. IMCC34043]|uniref:chlorophyll synthase ChlG n=1 Tax=Tropicimonas sp. IMCC34043 TaxID=2248760 RepID=UPI000E25FA47|nr:chlorophyll synthase ChlG [Tropicimonas sp. IMCC34043]